jgi:hypothetical protein
MVKKDIFISYSHKDSIWVRTELLPKLESHNFTTLVDYRDFTTGSLGIDEMANAVELCKRTLLVLSPDYIASSWSSFENAMAQSLDPAARWRRVITVLLKDCTLPLRLSIIHYRDLRLGDADEWDRLFRDLI